MELFSSYHIVSLLCCDDDEMRRREPPFIGREEGLIPWNMLDPHMKSTKPTSKYIELGRNLDTDVEQGGMCQTTKVGAKRARLGCGCTLVGPNHATLWSMTLCDLLVLAHGGFARS